MIVIMACVSSADLFVIAALVFAVAAFIMVAFG